MNVIAGLDVGGSKVAVRVETAGGERVADGRAAAGDWSAVPAGAAAAWLMEQLEPFLPGNSAIAALGVGAQGCDTPAIAADLQRALESLGLRAVVVNDGQLLLPAAGFDKGIGIVAGTGSIGVGTDAAGHTLLAGGWGWIIGDEGGAAAIVREATRAALAAHDEGRDDDGLLAALRRAFDVPSAERLARVVNDDPTVENWAPRASAVFAAAVAGSALADAVIEDAARHLATLVSRLIGRGAVGGTVVAAGSVIVRQPRLATAFGARLAARHPDLCLHILDQEPVTGAVVLARRLLARDLCGPADPRGRGNGASGSTGRLPVANCLAPFTLLLPLTHRGPALAFFGIGVFAATYGIVLAGVTFAAIRQLCCPPALLGRVQASSRLLTAATIPVGSLIGGAVGQHFGTRTAILGGAIGYAVVGVIAATSPLRKPGAVARLDEVLRHQESAAAR